MVDPTDRTIYIRKRPSTGDEDRWASGWIRREWTETKGSQTVFAIIVWTLACLIITAGAFALYGRGGWIAVIGAVIGVAALLVRHKWLGRNRPRVGEEPVGYVLTLSVPVLKAWQIDSNPSEHVIQFGLGLFMAGWRRSSRAPNPSRTGTSPGTRIELDYYIADCPFHKMVRGNRCLMAIRFIGEFSDPISHTTSLELPQIVYDADDWCHSHTFDEIGREGLQTPAEGVPTVMRDLQSPLVRELVTIFDETS